MFRRLRPDPMPTRNRCPSSRTPGPAPTAGGRHRRSSAGSAGRLAASPRVCAAPPFCRRRVAYPGSLPQEARHVVIADANALEQVLDPGGGIADGEGGLDPVTDLVGVAEASRADFGLELLDLLRGKFAGVALVVDRAEGVEPCVAIDPEPFPQLD